MTIFAKTFTFVEKCCKLDESLQLMIADVVYVRKGQVIKMKIALGMIISSLDTEDEIMRFIDNAEKYGHKLNCVIVAYTKRFNAQAASNINNKVPLHAVNINNPKHAYDEFHRLDISETATQTLLSCPVDTGAGLVPYGFNRTIVTIEAILRGIDILFFVDNDVFPTVLTETEEGITENEVDFFGEHLKQLKAGSTITTGEYSGYNILPPAAFDCMDDLLFGVQKNDMLDYWKTSFAHRCMTVQATDRTPVSCSKILGGNTALTLSAFSSLPTFFSSYYYVDDELYLNRGEDTVLGIGIANSGTVCTDIKLFPLHDTYKSYPSEPDLCNDAAAQIRFFYACTGWIGRNPFLNYINGNDLQSVRDSQRHRLERGVDALARYTSNPRFLSIMRNFDISWENVGRYINEYEQVLEAWDEFTGRSDIK